MQQDGLEPLQIDNLKKEDEDIVVPESSEGPIMLSLAKSLVNHQSTMLL